MDWWPGHVTLSGSDLQGSDLRFRAWVNCVWRCYLHLKQLQITTVQNPLLQFHVSPLDSSVYKQDQMLTLSITFTIFYYIFPIIHPSTNLSIIHHPSNKPSLSTYYEPVLLCSKSFTFPSPLSLTTLTVYLSLWFLNLLVLTQLWCYFLPSSLPLLFPFDLTIITHSHSENGFITFFMKYFSNQVPPQKIDMNFLLLLLVDWSSYSLIKKYH